MLIHMRATPVDFLWPLLKGKNTCLTPGSRFSWGPSRRSKSRKVKKFGNSSPSPKGNRDRRRRNLKTNFRDVRRGKRPVISHENHKKKHSRRFSEGDGTRGKVAEELQNTERETKRRRNGKRGRQSSFSPGLPGRNSTRI